jgi:hypothetical protein
MTLVYLLPTKHAILPTQWMQSMLPSIPGKSSTAFEPILEVYEEHSHRLRETKPFIRRNKLGAYKEQPYRSVKQIYL